VLEHVRQLACRRAAAAKLYERLCAIEVIHIPILASLIDKGRFRAGGPSGVSSRPASALAKDISAKKAHKRINTDWCVFNRAKSPTRVSVQSVKSARG
jgi:hypothetical protein